jgi:hypothetical protein
MPEQAPTGLFGQALQPWDAPGQHRDATIERERDRLLASLAASELGTIEARCAQILQTYPETRDNDIELALRYWAEYEAHVIAAATPLELEVLHSLQPMATLIRCRQRIQNDFGLFIGTRRTRGFRDERQMQFYQYLAEQRAGEAECCFYIDETGSEPQGRFVGIGGICILDVRAFSMHHSALKHWRAERGWVETLHFADADSKTESRFIELLAELQRHRVGLLFLGYATLCRGNRDSALASLIVQLVGDALTRADQLGCLCGPRSVRVIKEAADGFDSLHLDAIRSDLADHLAHRFPQRVHLAAVQPLPKGREVLLECADVIAASMKRRWESGSWKHKDRIAQAVMNVTGFEDERTNAAIYRVHATG